MADHYFRVHCRIGGVAKVFGVEWPPTNSREGAWAHIKGLYPDAEITEVTVRESGGVQVARQHIDAIVEASADPKFANLYRKAQEALKPVPGTETTVEPKKPKKA